MKRLVTPALAVVLAVSLSACASMATRRCNAFRDQLGATSEACLSCTDSLTPSGDANKCEGVCGAVATFTDGLVSACAAAGSATAPASAPAPTSAPAAPDAKPEASPVDLL